MKRLIFAFLAFVVLFSQNIVFSAPVDAAAAVKTMDANSLIGMPAATLVQKYGRPARMEPSEYGFTWYVYNKDYKNFFMAGVKGATVVAAYTNAKTLNYKNRFRLGSSKAAVRAVLGTPVSYYRSENTVFILNNADQKDVFLVGMNYVTVFYDVLRGSTVTSLLIVPQADEERVSLNLPELSGALTAAYQRISIDLVNAIRVRSGYKKLATNSPNTSLAAARSTDMRNRNYFSHYTPSPENMSPATVARKMKVRFSSLGENISYGDHNAILAHESFMNSSGHRANILNRKYTKVGMGVAFGGTRYVILTEIFTR